MMMTMIRMSKRQIVVMGSNHSWFKFFGTTTTRTRTAMKLYNNHHNTRTLSPSSIFLASHFYNHYCSTSLPTTNYHSNEKRLLSYCYFVRMHSSQRQYSIPDWVGTSQSRRCLSSNKDDTSSFLRSSNGSSSSSGGSDGGSLVDTLEEMMNRMDQDKNVVRTRVWRTSRPSNQQQQQQQQQDQVLPLLPPKNKKQLQRTLKDIATDICHLYLSSDPIPSVVVVGNDNNDDEKEGTACNNDREIFLLHLAHNYGMVDFSSLNHIIQLYQQQQQQQLNNDDDDDDDNISLDIRQKLKLVNKIREACVPPYNPIFHQILSSARRDLGLACLIELRKDVRLYMKRMEKDHTTTNYNNNDDASAATANDDVLPRLKQMDEDLKNLLATLFLQPLLELRRISYETTPAAIIEKVAMKEAVHPMKSLHDLRTRLGPNRRCFAFFHPSLPNDNDPLVFVHVALLHHMPTTMEQIDTSDATDHPTVATFYSITNTQPGLTGVDLGSFLIKRVVEKLQQEFPSIVTFCTLSPIPRLRQWINTQLTRSSDKFFDTSSLLNSHDIQTLTHLFQCSSSSSSKEEAPLLSLVQLLKDPQWYQNYDASIVQGIQPILCKLAAHYLVYEKHRGRPMDGVAKFHIGNGAEMYRLNYLADTSRKGIANSSGMMINYRYHLPSIDYNHVHYQSTGTIPVQPGVHQYLDNYNHPNNTNHYMYDTNTNDDK